MKSLFIVLFIFISLSSFEQAYPFAKDYVNAIITFRDASKKQGQIKWFPNQYQKLKFRIDQQSEDVKYSPEDVAGFSTDSLRFISVFNFEVYSDNYTLLGKPTLIKQTFAQVVDTGKFNIYLVLISGVDAINSLPQTYPNFLFRDVQNDSLGLVAYPFAIRMKEKKYEKAKENLYKMFKNYPELITKIETYKPQDDFEEIVNSVKAINKQ